MAWPRVCILLLAHICVSSALTSDEVSNAKREEEISLRQTYADLNKGVKNFIRDNIKSVIRVVGEKSQEFNVSSKCKLSAFKLLTGLRDLKIWALNFVDATGKLNDGFLSGSVHMYGNYDQCLNASVLSKNGAVEFRGQYCLLSVAAYLPKVELTPDRNERAALVKYLTQNLTEPIGQLVQKSELARPEQSMIGLCVPSGCDTDDVNNLAKYVSRQLLMNLTLNFCETEDTLVYFSPTRISILCVYLFFVILVIISSVIERYAAAKMIKFESPVMRGLICFSLPHNFQKLTSTNVTEGNLSFLNGIRVLSLFYVILGHHYLIKIASLMHRNYFSMAILTWSPRFFPQIMMNGLFTVDVFFFIGGFLNCYLRGKKNFTNFSFSSSLKIFFHRLIRIYPVYIFAILFKFLLNPRGPMAHYIDTTHGDPCRTQWWRNLLFINNIYNLEYQCFPHSWYLAADMQFFLVSLFTIPILFKNAKIGVVINLAIIFLSTTFTAVRVWTDKVLPTFLLTENTTSMDLVRLTNEQYASHPHASAYFGGVLLGFFLTQKKSLKFSKITLTLGWIVASTMFLTMLFVTKKWGSGVPFTRFESSLYFSLSRFLYSWSVGWLILCCFAGYGGFISSILSWKVWIPLNRLCLSAYLLSVILQIYYFGNLRTAQDFQHEIEIWSYFGDITITCLLSVPMVLLFESPFIALQKVIFHKNENSSALKENEMKIKENVKNENGTKSDLDKCSVII